jgi:hypothetical protein
MTEKVELIADSDYAPLGHAQIKPQDRAIL